MKAESEPFSSAVINGTPVEFFRGENVPELTASLISECDRRNRLNPKLIKINQNTWAKKDEQD